MTGDFEWPEAPTLPSEEVVWHPSSFTRMSGPMELKSGDEILAEAEWLDDVERPEWRVDAGREELAFRVVEWKPMRVEVSLLPDDRLVMVHRAARRRPRPAIEIGEARYFLIKSGFGWTSYRTPAGAEVARIGAMKSWTGGTIVRFGEAECPPWHLWILVCYAGFRAGATYKHMFTTGASTGLARTIGRAKDYGFVR